MNATQVEVAVEVAILVALALPFVRLATCRPFLRRLGGAPELAIVGTVALIGYFVAIGVIATFAPVLLRPLVAGALVAAGFAVWRRRPDYGVSRGVPRGSLRIAPTGPWTDPNYFVTDANRFGPIFKTSTFLYPTICVVGLPASLDLFRQHDQELIPPTNRFSRFIPRGFIRSMTDEDHARYAPILRAAVSGAATRLAEPDLRQTVRNELRRTANLPSSASGDGVTAGNGVRAGDITSRVVWLMFMRLFFGIQPDDPDIPRLEKLYRRIDPSRAWRARPGRIEAAVDEAARICGRRDVPDTFLHLARQAQPDGKDDATTIKNLVYMAQTGGSDASSLLTWATWFLSSHPDCVEGILRDADPSAASKRILMETLRLEQSEFLLRRASREIRWQGFVIPKGWRVRICVRESHRDPMVFANADRFDPDRWVGATHQRDRYSPFGSAASRTTCLGEGLTLFCGRIFIEELVRGYEWRVVDRAEPEFSGVHWRPSTKFRIVLEARQPVNVSEPHTDMELAAV